MRRRKTSRQTGRVKTTFDGALFVIGLHRSGGAIAHYPQDWEVANVALSCHIAFDMLCQNYTKLKGDVAGLNSERVFFVEGKEVNDRSF